MNKTIIEVILIIIIIIAAIISVTIIAIWIVDLGEYQQVAEGLIKSNNIGLLNNNVR